MLHVPHQGENHHNVVNLEFGRAIARTVPFTPIGEESDRSGWKDDRFSGNLAHSPWRVER